MRLLVVDDCVNIVNILTCFLELAGHEADQALNGREALEFLRQNSYDVVITDAMMPEMDGIELCKLIKANYPGIYVIGISGSWRDLNRLKAAGADVCFAKPFHIEEVEKTIESIDKGFDFLRPAKKSLHAWHID